jgi:hypothetical protein
MNLGVQELNLLKSYEKQHLDPTTNVCIAFMPLKIRALCLEFIFKILFLTKCSP